MHAVVLPMVPAVIGALVRRYKAFLTVLDAESIVAFQAMYYTIIAGAGLYLWLAADAPPQNVEPVMGHVQYQLWLGLNIICPIGTLVGRWLTSRSAKIDAGEPNPALGAAWLQFVCDAGVWGAIAIYVACIFETTEWGAGLYGAFFVLMGIPGGFMFTLRSGRRLLQIKKRERRMP
jgi:hypothetical protein